MRKVRKDLRRAAAFWCASILYAGIIFYLSSVPGFPEKYYLFPGQDKLIHVVEYFILSSLLYRAFKYSGYSRFHASSSAVILSCVYAMSDELHQAFVPGRQCSFFDYLSDTIGIIAAQAVPLYSHAAEILGKTRFFRSRRREER